MTDMFSERPVTERTGCFKIKTVISNAKRMNWFCKSGTSVHGDHEGLDVC